MPTTLTGVEIRPLTIPASLDEADAGEFVEMVAVRNQVYREIAGHDDHAMPAAELLPHFGPDPYQKRYFWVVVADGRIVGRAGVDLPLHDGSRTAYWQIELLAEVHGHGIGSQAYELVERTAAENGRTVLQSWAQHREAPGERLVPPTGHGSIPADDKAVRFYRRHGYTLEQIERCSILDLQAPLDAVEQLLAAARAASDGYRVVTWFAPTPAEHADGYAWLKSRMATDAPASTSKLTRSRIVRGSATRCPPAGERIRHAFSSLGASGPGDLGQTWQGYRHRDGDLFSRMPQRPTCRKRKT